MFRIRASTARPRHAARAGAAPMPRDRRRLRPAIDALEGRVVMDAGIALEPVAGLTTLNNPVLATSAQDASGRLFVVEQGGRILVRQPGGAVSVFLDISATAANPANRRVQAGGEQGLIGLAFHPQFEQNGRFYLHHTRSGLTNTNDVAEYRVSAANPNVADPASERVLLRIPQPFTNHNGGSIAFGPDGLLYIAKGDGGSGNDPNNNAQNVNSLLGKILRIDVDRDAFPTDPLRNYAIPVTNPYANGPGADEIFAIGLRNPYRVSFDRVSGTLYAGDVGQGQREEINTVTLGGNYGWRPFEGSIPTPGIDPAEGDAIRSSVTFPITELDRTLARSITGGYAYRGTRGTLPQGSYLFGDFITGNLFLLEGGTRTTLSPAGFNVASFGEDDAGELYVVRYGGGNGAVLKVVPTAADPAPVLIDPGFESPEAGPNGVKGSFLYRPAGPAWAYAGDAGVAANGSGFTSGNPPAPEGDQVAFLQRNGRMTRVVDVTAGTYRLSFLAAERGNWQQGGAHDFAVLVDGAEVARFTPPGSSYREYGVTLDLSAGGHTVAFVGLNSAGGDNTSLIDDVRLARASSLLSDPGFESPEAGPNGVKGSFLYRPAGPAWAYAGDAGVAANGSGFTSGNPPAPEGDQVAFLQRNGRISQVINMTAAGSYRLSFLAAGRGNWQQGGAHDFAVLVDGAEIARFTVSNASYRRFQVALDLGAGARTIAFVGLNSAGGDNTSLLDAIRLDRA